MIKNSVFISGSISIKMLTPNAIESLDKIIDNNMLVFIGDANGTDLLVQKHLAYKGYRNVTVYHTGSRVRNNFSEWSTNSVPTDIAPGSREFYTVKDKAMANDAEYGLMIWDGISKGTASNINMMKSLNKQYKIIM
jgi:hypothetical protein